MLTGANSDRAWQQIGRDDPYFGVLTHPRYRRGQLDEQARLDFFRSGQDHVEQLLSDIRTHLDPRFEPRRALDFGCGVGRLAVALARQAHEVVAVDVAEAMLAETRANCERQGLRNVRLVRSDDALSDAPGPFDLIHSYLVFQHIPVRRGEKLLAQMAQRLAPGGVAAWQFVIGRECSSWRRAITWAKVHVPAVTGVCNLAAGLSWSEPMMQMNRYDLSRVLHLLYANGCTRLFARTGRDGEYVYSFLMAQKK